jgi:glutathione S-transferase
MALKLWHCAGSRSIRPLWTLLEMGLDFELETMLFPPRFAHPGYTELNPIGTVPFFTDSSDPANLVSMTESSGISQYLADKYGPTDLAVLPSEPAYGEYLNWLHRSDATLILEPEATRLPKVAEDYTKWFFSRLRSVELALSDGREFLCADRFTLADISVGFALHFAELLSLKDGFKPYTLAYVERLKQRPSFQQATANDGSQNILEGL